MLGLAKGCYCLQLFMGSFVPSLGAFCQLKQTLGIIVCVSKLSTSEEGTQNRVSEPLLQGLLIHGLTLLHGCCKLSTKVGEGKQADATACLLYEWQGAVLRVHTL